MKQGIIRRNATWIAVLLSGFGAVFAARADALVFVSAFSLSPNPVYISTGDAVFWTDGDGGGPYGIYSSTGQWSTETDSYGIQFLQAGNYGYYDDNGNIGTVNVTLNIPPSVTIDTPTNQMKFPAPATFQFSVTALDTDADGLSDVEFYVGTNLVDDVFSDPFTTGITNLPTGAYTLTAIAYDNAGATATNSVSITVGTVASTNYILPIVSGDIYSSGSVNTNSYLDTGGNIRGALEFAVFDATPYSSILLALNPYALPLFSPGIDIYGFDGGTGTLFSSNYNSGTFIGTLVFPPNPGFGQVATFDVTHFVQSVKGPYFGFILQGTNSDTLSSLSYNYGTPPELIAAVSTLPPKLIAKQLGNQLVISWNTNNADGLSVQSTTNLVSGIGWTAVPIIPSPFGSQLTVTNPIVGTKQFFRLSNH